MTHTISRTLVIYAAWFACLAILVLVGSVTSFLIDPIHHAILIGGGIWLGVKFPGRP